MHPCFQECFGQLGHYPFKSEVLQYFSRNLLQLLSVNLLVAVRILNVCQRQTISVTFKNKLRRGASASNWIVYSRGTSISHDGRDREKHPSRVCASQLWKSSLFSPLFSGFFALGVSRPNMFLLLPPSLSRFLTPLLSCLHFTDPFIYLSSLHVRLVTINWMMYWLSLGRMSASSVIKQRAASVFLRPPFWFSGAVHTDMRWGMHTDTPSCDYSSTHTQSKV